MEVRFYIHFMDPFQTVKNNNYVNKQDFLVFHNILK